MKISKLLIVTLLCVGLGSAADAKQKGHRQHGKHAKKGHQTSKKVTPVAPVASVPPAPPAPVPPTPAPPGHHTITPSVVSINSPGVWTYAAMLSSGTAMDGDGFTIFDFGGYVAGSILAPAGWSAVAQLTGSVLGIAPPAGYVDNPGEFNLLFTRTGGTIGPINGMQDLGHFEATTTFTSTAFVGWSSRDHLPFGSPPGPGTDHADYIEAPAQGAGAVPDGGATVALLGIALTGLGAMRRMIGARKA